MKIEVRLRFTLHLSFNPTIVQELILYIQLVLSGIFVVVIALPLIRNSYWIFRIFEYPRFQVWAISLLVLASWLFTFNTASTAGKIVAGLLAAGFIYLTYKILPYTPFSKKQMHTVSSGDQRNQLRIFTANVYQDNRAYDRIKNQVRKYDPDLVLLVETDEAWKLAMDEILETHPEFLGKALSNTYGMLLYSRLKIVEGKVRYLVENDIPGIKATIQLPSQQMINIWGVHPKPPVPGESEDSKAKDSEIMKVAFEAERSDLPVIVMGDFNDVAWSKVTELFQKTARLLDPRRGRGFYSTFSAFSLFIRFPLDYIFCSVQFGLLRMKRLPKNGSDHFAILTHLQYDSKLANRQDIKQPNSEEREEAKEKAMESETS